MGIVYQILATLTFFTRLPLWRLCDIPREYYQKVVPFWPLAGLVTGGVMGGVFVLASSFLYLPVSVSAVLAIAARIMLTGALHEDGFADFCDGFGGGTSKERTLEIMKDSHIGTFGVIGLIFYLAMLYLCITEVIPEFTVSYYPAEILKGGLMILGVDCLAKYFASHIVVFLPYARKESEAKNKLIYNRPSFVQLLSGLIITIIGVLPFFYISPTACIYSILTLPVVLALLFFMMKRTIGGYTGDCCGATFAICEMSIYTITLISLAL